MSWINIEIDSWHTSSGQLYTHICGHKSAESTDDDENSEKKLFEKNRNKKAKRTNENILSEKAIFGIKYGNECAAFPEAKRILRAQINRLTHTGIRTHPHKRNEKESEPEKNLLVMAFIGSNLSCHISSFIIYLIIEHVDRKFTVLTHWPHRVDFIVNDDGVSGGRNGDAHTYSSDDMQSPFLNHLFCVLCVCHIYLCDDENVHRIKEFLRSLAPHSHFLLCPFGSLRSKRMRFFRSPSHNIVIEFALN